MKHRNGGPKASPKGKRVAIHLILLLQVQFAQIASPK